jgi:hypothetical protein
MSDDAGVSGIAGIKGEFDDISLLNGLRTSVLIISKAAGITPTPPPSSPTATYPPRHPTPLTA